MKGSHALRVRGLKLSKVFARPGLDVASHALRVRGLKPKRLSVRRYRPCVARSTRAWIETAESPSFMAEKRCRTPCACVD